jgi:hypothetical protein
MTTTAKLWLLAGALLTGGWTVLLVSLFWLLLGNFI